jgi:hypothetical protein
MIKTDEMVEETAKLLIALYNTTSPNATWPSQIPQANIIVSAIVALANSPQAAEQADLPPQG